MKCPCCKKDNERVLFRQHWSKKYNEFICGNCRLEFELLGNNVQLMYNKLFEFEYFDEIQKIRQRVANMNEEQLLARLEELKKK